MFQLFWQQYGNSMIYSLAVSVCSIIIAIPTGYAMVRWDSKWMKVLFWICCVLLFLPFQVTMLPSYILFDHLELLDTVWAIIVPGMVSPLPILVIWLGNKKASEEYEEAFRLESNSLVELFVYILIPNMKLVIMTAFVITFTLTWNMVDQPLIFLSRRELWPLSLGLVEQEGILWWQMIIYMIPEVIALFSMLVFLIGNKKNTVYGEKKVQ